MASTAHSYLPTIPSGDDMSFSWPTGSSVDHSTVNGAPPSPASPLSPQGSTASGRIRAGAFGKGSASRSSANGDSDRLYQVNSNQPSSPQQYNGLPTPVLRPPSPPSPAASSSASAQLYPASPLGTAGHSPNLLSPPIFLPSRTLPSPPTGQSPSPSGPQRSEASTSMYSTTSYGGRPSLHSRPMSTDTRASGTSSSGGTELMMDIMAGQASVDVRDCMWKIMSWDEVEDAKKELVLLENRLQSLMSRHQREQKILTAARTLASLHINHKRMSRQTTDELSIAEKRAASAEKDLWAVKDRESLLRRRLTEHYAAILTWESTRLQTALRSAASTPQPSVHSPSAFEKGKARETNVDAEVDRLQSRVRELEELVGDAGDREAVVQAELKMVKRQFDGHRSQADEDRVGLESELKDLGERLRTAEDSHSSYRTREEGSRQQGLESVQAILSPLLDRATPDEEESLEDLALKVRDQFESLEAEVRAVKSEMKDVREGLESELQRVSADRERFTHDHAGKEKRWEEEKGGFIRQIKELSGQHRRQRSTDASSTLELASLTATLSHLWTLLPNPTPPSPSPTSHVRSPSSWSSRSGPNGAGGSDFNLAQFITSLSMPNTSPYTGIDAFSSVLKSFIEDALTVVEKTGKYAKERDIHKSNSERAQRLVMESRGALETYQRQVRALEERLENEGGAGAGGDSLAHFNELESTIADLREEKRRLEASLRSQMEACDSLSEANEALSIRAMSISDQAASEKRTLQTRLEAELSKLRSDLLRTQDDLDDFRSREMQGPGIEMLEQMNELQDEVAKLRAQLRAKGGA